MESEQVALHDHVGTESSTTEKYVTISVDDGDPSDLRTVDLLLKYGLQATFYIPAANAERSVMSPCEIREIDRQFEVGSHTLNHVRLPPLPAEKAWRAGVDCVAEQIDEYLSQLPGVRGHGGQVRDAVLDKAYSRGPLNG